MSPDEARAMVAAANKRREDRIAENEDRRVVQEVADLEAWEAIAEEYGEENLSRLYLNYTEGCPTFLAVRTPTPGEVKRYQSAVKPKTYDKAADTIEPAMLLAAACRVYPPKTPEGDVLYKLVGDKRPGVYTRLGLLALALSGGREESEGKG